MALPLEFTVPSIHCEALSTATMGMEPSPTSLLRLALALRGSLVWASPSATTTTMDFPTYWFSATAVAFSITTMGMEPLPTSPLAPVWRTWDGGPQVPRGLTTITTDGATL